MSDPTDSHSPAAEKPQPDDAAAPSPSAVVDATDRAPVLTLGSAVAAALACGILVAAGFGIAEFLATTFIYGAEGYRRHWSWTLYGAYAGRMIASHLLVWPSWLLLVGLAYFAVARRRPKA
ncbi:MAG: hypothetical protein D6744_06290, partial [Planctomycetota bacterium]